MKVIAGDCNCMCTFLNKIHVHCIGTCSKEEDVANKYSMETGDVGNEPLMLYPKSYTKQKQNLSKGKILKMERFC